MLLSAVRDARAIPTDKVLVTAHLSTDAKVQHLPRPNPAGGSTAQPGGLATLCGTRRGRPHWVKANSFHQAWMPLCQRCARVHHEPEAPPALAFRMDAFMSLTHITSEKMQLDFRNVLFVNRGSLVWFEPDYEGLFPYSPVAYPTSGILVVDQVPSRVETDDGGLRRYRGFWIHPREVAARKTKAAADV